MSSERPPRNRKELYERIARGGKDEVIVEEMIRLGFWGANQPAPLDPPDEAARARELRTRLGQLRTEAARIRNLAALEVTLKKQRMAESRRQRELSKQRRLAERAAFRAETHKTRELTYLGPGVSADGPAGKRWGDSQADVLAAALGYASYVAMVDPARGAGLRDRVLALKARHAAK